MIKIYDIGNTKAEMKVDKGTSYHEILLGAVMLIEMLVKDKGNEFEDVIDDITAIYKRDNEEKNNG